MTFDDREDDILKLQLQESGVELTEPFAAGSFEEIQVTPVINVITQRAVGVCDTMDVAKDRCSHGPRLRSQFMGSKSIRRSLTDWFGAGIRRHEPQQGHHF